MSKSITQDMRYRQSLMQYAANMARAVQTGSTIKPVVYLLLEGTLGWKCGVSGLPRPHYHPNQHTEAELKFIRDGCSNRHRQSKLEHGGHPTHPAE